MQHSDKLSGAPWARRAPFWQAWERWREKGIEWLIRICGWSAIFFVLAIFFFIFREAVPVLFGELDLREFLTSPNWRPTSEVRPSYGILALLSGALTLAGIAMAVAVPVGLAAAVFVSEFCSGKKKEALKIVGELPVPSHWANCRRCPLRSRYCADLAFLRSSTATIINTANTQSGISGFRLGPVRGHSRSACLHNGIAILTNDAKHVPAVARLPILGTSVGRQFLLRSRDITHAVPCA